MRSGMGEGKGVESAKICELRMECLWRSGVRRGQENICGMEMGEGDQRSSEDRTRKRCWRGGRSA